MKLQLYALDEIEAKLRNRNLMEVSRITGISYPTIYALAKGVEKDFRISTMQEMTDFLTLEDTLTELIEE